jgi:hypothetical protein
MESEKNLYRADIQTVSLLKDMRQTVHNICREHADQKVRIEAIDGQVFEGVIIDYDDQNVYLEVEEEEEEEEYVPREVSARSPYHASWRAMPAYPGPPFPYPVLASFGPYPGYPGFGGGFPSFPEFGYGTENPYGYFQMNPYGYQPNIPPGQVSPYSGKASKGQASPAESGKSQVSPYTGKESPAQVSPYSGGKESPGLVSPFGAGNEPPGLVSPFEDVRPFPPYYAPVPPYMYPVPVPLPPVKHKKKRRRCKKRRVIPLALYTLLTITLV